jgi:hypothetical protein
MKKNNDILQLLPGFNCGVCGYPNCESFASALREGLTGLNKCRVLEQDRYKKNRIELERLDLSLKQTNECTGLIDHCKADFRLYPLPGEISCRETLVSFSPVKPEKNMTVRYRPLGCPIIHFARIITVKHGLPDVWVTGPGRAGNDEITDLGICMILSFQGVIDGKMPEVGQTVKFLPGHCMMGKVHSGVIVHLEDNKARIDCIDLKIWEHANKSEY